MGWPTNCVKWWTICSPIRRFENVHCFVPKLCHFVDEHRAGKRDWSMQLWQFLTLELWIETFLEGGAWKFACEAAVPIQAATA
jgi:hypothetical protein